MTEMVPLSKIRDNPHRDKKRNPIDQEKVEQLKESIDTTGFWKGIYGRRVGGFVEIAYGHNRVEAARLAGLEAIPVEVEDLSDADMLMRMTRENLRGELLVCLEAVNAAVKAYGTGVVKFEIPDPKTRKDNLRYAPSFIPGKPSVDLGSTHPYTADTLARFLGGIYVFPDKHAQFSVRAALGVLEMEERKVKGFSDRILQAKSSGQDEDGGRYLGAKKIIQIVSDVKQREVKIAERVAKTKEEVAQADAEQRRVQAEARARQAAEEKKEKALLEKLAEAEREENAKKVKAIQAKLAAEAAAAEEKAALDKIRISEIDAKVAATKAKAEAQREVDDYLPTKREAVRILHKLQGETSTTKEALAEEVKALVRRNPNQQDREQLRQAAMTMGTWYMEWVAMQFLPPLSSKKQMAEYRTREAANRRAEEAKQEKKAAKAEKEKHGKTK